ncbi:Ff.00g114800.m01.CDS01 [Fusarium sp. VM40]|nr:Ff.00g114800.m01.CDS01 [Fusarium sp. VM40]
MAGIAEMFKKNTGDQYLAGLWKSRLVEGLGWVVLNPISRPKNPFRVPSWSWAAVDSAILPQGTVGGVTNLVHVIDASVEHSLTSAGCEQIKGSIQLRCCVSKATVFESNRFSGGENVVLRLMETSSKVFAYPDTLATMFEVGKELHFIPLRSTIRIKETSQMPLTLIEGLMLEAVSGVENTFRRIGQFVIFPSDHGGFFGLITTPSKSCEEVAFVKLEEAQKSIVTLV